jgi:hypothetical protein
MHSISLWDVVLLFFYSAEKVRLKRGSSGHVMASV